MKFIAGLVLGLIVMPLAVYLYFSSGSAPVATTDSDMPFETYLGHKALGARVAKEMPKIVPIQTTEANFLAGAELYKQHCAVCHGLPLSPKTSIANGMYPHPPQLFQGKGVTDDEPGETYWKVFNGIRLIWHARLQQIAFGKTQMWEVAILLARTPSRPQRKPTPCTGWACLLQPATWRSIE